MKITPLCSLLHHSIFHILISMFLTGSVTAAKPNTLRLLKYANRRHPSPMQRVVVDNSTWDVYVSARNTIYHLGSDLRLKGIVSTGPELDSPQCLHPDFPCTQNRTETDNDNKVLEIFQKPNFTALLTCGTLYHGLCQLHKLDDISRRGWLQPFNDTTAFISGRGSTVAVFAEGFNNQWSLYSATTYDGRPLQYTSASVSSKVIGDDFTVKYTYKTDNEYTGVDFFFKQEYKVSFCFLLHDL